MRQRAIRESAAGLYEPAGIEAWAAGGSEQAVRRKIAGTAGFVAVVDGDVVGWAALDGAEVDQLYVRPDNGGAGVARRLYEALEAHARGQGLTRLTAVASLRARPVFLSFGFTEVGRARRSFNGHTYEVSDMSRCIRAPAPRSSRPPS
ncbi:MAG: GNAT family N-acetyltransferase [Thermoleophilaceae bacterium]|nr:GNAT family N-acetyltransferase [Thermoleophilaceae bacterium]